LSTPTAAPIPTDADVFCLTVFNVVGPATGDWVVKPWVTAITAVPGVAAEDLLLFELLESDELPPTAAIRAFFAFCA
jgi:hypothetical protein